MKKRCLSVFLTLAMCLSLLPVTALAEEPQVLGDFSVIVNSGSATLSDTTLELTTGGTYTVSMAEGKTNSEVIILITGSGSGVVTNITVNGVTCAGLEDISTSAVNFTLMGENVFSISGVAGGGPLTIGGTGSLTADNGINADNRHIIINSGTIIANGNDGEAGIGSAYASKGIVTINDGIVTATGGEFAAGIGGGNSSTGNVTINGGIIAATGDQGAASIGDGSGAGGSGTVVISGGIVTAFRGNGAVSLGSAGGGSSVTIIGGGFTIDPRVSGAYRVGWQTTGGNVAVKLNGTDIEAAGVNQTVSVIPTPNSGYELKGLYLLGSNDTAPTENHYIDTTAFRTNALGGSYDFDMPNQHVTVHAVFQQTASGESYPITTEVIGYPGARLYAYTGAYPYDAELNDAGAVTEAALYSTVDVMLDASTSDISINKLPLDYELVGLYLNPTDYPESHYIDSEAFVSNYMSWGEGQIYGGSWYRFMVLGPTHVVAVVAPTGGSVEFPQHAVTYNADGGSGEMPADTAAQGASFALPECGFTPPDGQQFKAWLINDVEYAPGDGVRFTEDTDVVAVWEDIPVAVTGLAITTQPRLSYTEGEALDLAALAVTATYSDGSTESLDYGDVTCSPAHGTQLTAAHNGQTITVTFGGKTARTNALVVSAASGNTQTPPSAPELGSKTHNSVILLEMASSDATNSPVEYSKDGGATWQSSPVFTGLSASTTYRFAARYAAIGDYTASPASPITEVTTDAAPYTPPYVPPSSDNDDTPSTPPTQSVTIPISGDEETIHVGVTVSGGKAAVEDIDLGDLGEVIGDGLKVGTVDIDFSGLNTGTPVNTVEIPADAIKQISEAVNDPNNDAESMKVIFTDGTSVEFDAESLSEKAAQANGQDITIAVKSAGSVALTPAQRNAVGSRPAYDINISSGGEPISDMGGIVTMRFPYKLQAGEEPGGLIVWYVDDNGNKEACMTDYDSKTEQVSATTDHMSLYMIDYDENYLANCPRDESCPMYPYTDVVIDSWYHDGVHYAIENGLMQGTSTAEMLFSPNGTTTRAQIVTILWRMEGAPAVDYLMQFSDVAEEQWHTEAIRWAASTGITSGTGDGTTFSPNDPITREQFAAFLYRYAQYKGYDVSVGEDTNILSYEDAFTVSEYAYPALQWACGAGIIGGMNSASGGMILDPQGSATRAQAAVMLMRFCENVNK